MHFYGNTGNFSEIHITFSAKPLSILTFLKICVGIIKIIPNTQTDLPNTHNVDYSHRTKTKSLGK